MTDTTSDTEWVPDAQQTLSIPWMIDTFDGKCELLVSAPDGGIIEIPLTPEIAKQFPSLISQRGLWAIFFNSLVASLTNAKSE